MTVTRRTVLSAAGAASLGASLTACAAMPTRVARRGSGGPKPYVVVVGAGVFGAWTAEHLRRGGADVLLVDQAGPGHTRASSGGESRMTRSAYGRDGVYTEMALASLEEWKALSVTESTPLFHPCGVLFVFQEMVDYARDSLVVHRELDLPLFELDQREIARRWPQMNVDGVAFGLYEPEFGALMARRGVRATVRRFVADGGSYRRARAVPDPEDGRAVLVNGDRVQADAVIYACGPWLGGLFPDVAGPRLFVTRQEVAYLAPPAGDGRFGPNALPGWADYNGGDLYYGFPDLEGRGFKIARDTHGATFDPEGGDRAMTAEGALLLQEFAARRFPALAGRPFTEFRVCQYTNSSNGDFLMDRHPAREGTWLLGAGSGHGFKHGPEVGRLMADLALGRVDAPNPRFALAAKDTAHKREVL